MAKKSSSRKSLKTLFSRSDANLNESAQKEEDRTEAAKKKSKFRKFKIKSKKVSPSERSVTESQQVHRYAHGVTCFLVCAGR